MISDDDIQPLVLTATFIPSIQANKQWQRKYDQKQKKH